MGKVARGRIGNKLKLTWAAEIGGLPRVRGEGKAPVSIRYTSDSHGQGVHEGQPVSNELVSWVGAGRDQHSSQHFLLEGALTAGLG